MHSIRKPENYFWRYTFYRAKLEQAKEYGHSKTRELVFFGGTFYASSDGI